MTIKFREKHALSQTTSGALKQKKKKGGFNQEVEAWDLIGQHKNEKIKTQ